MRAFWLALLLAACAAPPPTAYLSTAAHEAAAPVPIGSNTVGEACTQQAQESGGADIYCGTWTEPSARVRPAPAGAPLALARESPWRTELDVRYACGAPTATTILGDAPTALLQCTRRNGGWPHVALVVAIGSTIWFADGVLPALPVIERAIGVLSGRSRAGTVLPSGANALLAQRLAARAFSSGDVGQYEALTHQAELANREGDSQAAGQAWAAALALVQKAQGANAPATATPAMSLALQLSNQGRFAEADAYFARAGRVAELEPDPTAPARLLQYRAMHLVNQDHPREALALFDHAERLYGALVPDSLTSRPHPRPPRSTFEMARLAAAEDALSGLERYPDPFSRRALLGVLETRRNRAWALRTAGDDAAAAVAVQSAEDYALANGLLQPGILAYVYRSAGIVAAVGGRSGDALFQLDRSAQDFMRAYPRTRPLAETQLRRAAALVHDGRRPDALAACEAAATILRGLREGVDPVLLEPCLTLYAQAATGADAQNRLAAMFELAQLTRGSVTSQQIQQAAARLTENARDPAVAAAIRRLQDGTAELNDLSRARAGATAATAADLDARIDGARAAVADADSALQAASPQYGQLVQQVVPASAVLALLAPGEAYAGITLTDAGGWTFLLRNGRIAVAPVAGSARIAALVQRLRAGLEPTGNGLPPFDADAARALYDATLGGVAAALEGARALTVVTNGPLLSVPFGVLLTGPADPAHLATAPFLIRRMVVTHDPSAANFVGLRRIAGGSRAPRPWIGFGDFRPASPAQAQRTFPGPDCANSAAQFAALPPLPQARRELEAARLLTGATPDDELVGAAFTVPALKQRDLKQYRVLHFAAHALLPAELSCEAEPAIVASTPADAADASAALLTASVVTGLDLDADAVILSACNTGGPGGVRGESLAGLARAFLFAGARSLLVTHWAAEDTTAAYLVATTLNTWRAHPGDGIAAALRSAQLSLLDDPEIPAVRKHPSLWAPFAIIGEGGSPASGA
jgi:CHAT domain-containing protein